MNFNHRVFLYVLLPVLTIPYGVELIHGDIRDEIEREKNRLEKLKDKLVETNKDIIKQKEKIEDNKKEFEDAEKHEKTLKGRLDSSWDAHKDLEDAEDETRKALEKYKDSEDKLQELFDKRNSIIKEISDLEVLIDEMDIAQPPKTQDGLIAISLDSTCKSFIKNNFTSECPTFELINTLYPASPCNYSETGCIRYYEQVGGFHYLIDPPASVMERIKVIEVRYEFDEYHFQDSKGYDSENHTINYGVGRYVDGCKNAYIDSSEWIRYMGDTIYYFHKGCDSDYTNLDKTRAEQLNTTEFSIVDSYKYQLDQWIKESKERCLNECWEY